MAIWITSDTHFGHTKLIDVGDRPANFEHRILKNWRGVVASDDMVIHLGDVFLRNFSGWKKTFTNLPGRKILVVGNHDKNSLHWYMHNGFDFACHKFTWQMYGKSLLFTHAPMVEFLGDLNIHGHLHTESHRDFDMTDRHYLVSLEKRNYLLTSLKSIVQSKFKDVK